MFDPFTIWSRMAAAGLDFHRTCMRGAEMLEASSAVIGARTTKMRDAAISPMDGDLSEFTRMVPEKMEAFTRSGQAISRDLLAMQSAYFAQAQRVGVLMASGRWPTASELSTFIAGSTEYALGTLDAGARLGDGALAPVHKAAVANARRLRRRG